MLLKFAAFYVVSLVLAALGDIVFAAIIAGAFSMLNTGMLFVLHQRTSKIGQQATDIRADQEQVRAALTAPRRIVYDQDGAPIGTVIDLHRGGGWDQWLTQHGRRADDDDPV